MGVTALWTVVSPTARPTSLASLNRKRLAVDASIWIYQFLKAVRDKEGNALRNSHIVGFFRRICKLLYFGIKPVFVFDGGAPVLKRETVRKRRVRREGRREDAVKTAGKLLAVQMERVMEEERENARRRREGGGGGREGEGEHEEDIGDEGKLVYVDELGMGEAERKKGRAQGFKRRDQYHLPDLDVRIEDMGAPNDPRIMSQAELEEYARQFHSGEDINLYDFSKIDFESPFFLSLPAGDRYNILNAARLRSRLRMGYTKDQLNGMFPDRMAFSKFQVERVRERNELTQRLMHINGGDEWESGGRIAGEKGKEYVLVKNDGVEGGWALGVVSNKLGTSKNMAIDVDEDDDLESKEEDSDEFEDVEIEGLNRLPKSWKRKRARSVDYDYSYEDAAEQIAKKRKAVYDGRKAAAADPTPRPVVSLPERVEQGANEVDSLFVPQDQPDEDDDLFEDVDIGQANVEEEDDDLQKAIAMSLERPPETQTPVDNGKLGDSEDSDDDAFDMRAALAESRKTKQQPPTAVRNGSPKPADAAPKFSGPLPFESLNLGQSLLGKKKSKKVEENLSGGFDRDLGQETFRKERPPQPMPSWFDAAAKTKDMKKMREIDNDDEDGEDHVTHDTADRSRREILHRHPTKEVIDLEAECSTQPKPSQIELSSDSEDGLVDITREPEPEPDDWQLPEHEEVHEDVRAERERQAEEEAREARYAMAREIAGESDMPEEAPPPVAESSEAREKDLLFEPEGAEVPSMDEVAERVKEKPPSPTEQPNFNPSPAPASDNREDEDEDEIADWSASEVGSPTAKQPPQASAQDPEDDEDEFEDVPMNDFRPPTFLQHQSTSDSAPRPPQGDAANYLLPAEDENEAGPSTTPNGTNPIKTANTNTTDPLPPPEDDFSDSDEELMRQLAIEVEEHARFTNSLTNPHHKSTTSATNDPTNSASALRDYEAELKQLRSHQKSSLRDADEVTSTMISDCQALLSLFGLPYITAPMEAEAQCAELVRLGLVDGIVTDDSDIFLFGGTRIYKNMFNAAKFVECYLSQDLEREYTLTRSKLIEFAHLLGSDYTEGLVGIGPVTALEILTDFTDLSAFREWLESVQRAHRPSDLEGLLTTPFRRKFKSAAQKRIFVPSGAGWPDKRVDAAYLYPEVDSNPEQFVWGVPDLDRLRGFLMQTIGWSQERTDEVLVPVVRDMNRREKEGTQSNITRFFEGGVGVGANPNQRGRGVNGQNAGNGSAVGNAALAAVAGIDPTTAGSGDAGAGLGQRNRTGKESGRMKNAYRKLRGEAERRRRGAEDGEVVGEESGVPSRREGEEEEGGDVDVEAVAPGGAVIEEGEDGRKKNGTGVAKRRGTKKQRESRSVSADDGGEGDTADDESYKPATKKKQAAGRGRRRKAAA